MNVNKKLSLLCAGIAALVLGFQNCSDVQFSSRAELLSELAPSDFQEATDVEGGHFDLDTATAVYTDGEGDTNHHEHEYDDKYNTNVANFFSLENAGFDDIPEVVAADQSFYILVANADLSPRVALEVNGAALAVSNGLVGPFSLSGVAGTAQLNSLRGLVASDAILNNGLVSTQTNCVRNNNFSEDGRYRNGALVFQAIRSDQLDQVDSGLGVAMSTDALLWEAALFWHEDGGSCR